MGPVAEQRIYNCNLSGRVGERVSVYGWVHVRRDHGKLIFIDLRDETALLQVVLRPEASELSRAIDHSVVTHRLPGRNTAGREREL